MTKQTNKKLNSRNSRVGLTLTAIKTVLHVEKNVFLNISLNNDLIDDFIRAPTNYQTFTNKQTLLSRITFFNYFIHV